MTCRMAAGQQKKRLTNSNQPEQYRSNKKPKFDSSECLINLKSHIDLKWDDARKIVIPRKDLIGISWSDLAPFIESTQKHRSGLADVTCVPREIFALENLTGVLSYEVWASCLTEAERKFLMQFLPSGTYSEEIVHLLLTGENHRFGNPFLSWSTSLCYGNLHPDAVLNEDRQIRADEQAYHVELNNYYSNMIDILKKWREKWLTCDDPENLFRDNPAKQKQRDLQSPAEKPLFLKVPNREMPMKVVRNGDVSKFMSYIKISRAQHDLVRRMKQSGDGIQTKHLTRVIGDIDNFHVKPYETLMEDEKKRLQKHWVDLSCKDIPAAFEVFKDRKLLIEKLTESLGLELAEKNISVLEKAEQIADRTEEFGQYVAHENDDVPDSQVELVEGSPQDSLQVGNGHSPALEDELVKAMSNTDTSIRCNDSLNMNDQDFMDINSTNIATQSQNSSEKQDQDLNDVSCTNTSDSGDNPDEPDGDLKDMSHRNGTFQIENCLGMPDEDINDISCTDTAVHDNDSLEMQTQELKATSHTSSPVQSHNSPNMKVQDLEDAGYRGSFIHGHGSTDQQGEDLNNNSNTSDSSGHNIKSIPSAASCHLEMNPITVDQREAPVIAMIPLNSSSLLAKSSSEKIHMEDTLELKEHTAKSEKDEWQSAGTLDSYYHPQDNSMYAQSGELQLKHHLPGGRQASIIDLERDARSQQQAQVTIASAFPLCSTASLLQPCTNRQNNEQLQTVAKDIGMVSSFSLEHMNGIKQSVDLHSLANNCLAQSALVPNPLQEQMQLLDQRHNGLYMQQVNKNLYSGARFCTQETFPVVEQQTFTAHTSADRSCNWFSEDHQSHNSWSGMESDRSEAHVLPGGSTADGSLFSVLSQYKQASSRTQFGMSSSDQFLERRNLVHAGPNIVPRAQSIVPPAPDIYGYTQNLPGNPSSNVASVDASLNNIQWTNFTQHSPGMRDPSIRQFRAPWSR